MKKILIAVGIVALLVVCWRWSAAIPQDLDPLKVAPDTHKLVFENRFVRVLEVHGAAGQDRTFASARTASGGLSVGLQHPRHRQGRSACGHPP
jgi:hypothetical protein